MESGHFVRTSVDHAPGQSVDFVKRFFPRGDRASRDSAIRLARLCAPASIFAPDTEADVPCTCASSHKSARPIPAPDFSQNPSRSLQRGNGALALHPHRQHDPTPALDFSQIHRARNVRACARRRIVLYVEPHWRPRQWRFLYKACARTQALQLRAILHEGRGVTVSKTVKPGLGPMSDSHAGCSPACLGGSVRCGRTGPAAMGVIGRCPCSGCMRGLVR